MRVLLINTTYNIGSTGKLIDSFFNYLLEKDVEVCALFGEGGDNPKIGKHNISSGFERRLCNMMGRLTGLNDCFSFFSTNKAIKIIDSFSPEVVFIGNVHGHYINFYSLYNHLRKRKIPIVKIMWDEYAMTGSCSFAFDCNKYTGECFKCPYRGEYPKSLIFDTSRLLQKIKRRSYKDQNIVFVSVPYIVNRAKNSFLLGKYHIFELDEAVDQENIYYPRECTKLRKELGISTEKKVILNVCNYPNNRKGGKYYLDLAKACLDMKDVVFIHVGFMGDKKECPSNYIPIGYEKNQQKMAEYYSLSDLFVCTSLAETQPNTCLEALSCGTPICGFDISGVPTCAVEPFGEFVKFPDIEALRNIVSKTPIKNKESVMSIVNYARNRFSSDRYNSTLFSIGESIVKEKSLND